MLLPDWWDDALEGDPSILQDVEIRIARFLGTSLRAVGDPTVSLAPPAYPHAQLRRVRDIAKHRLGPAIHAAVEVAKAVVRGLQGTLRVEPLPLDGLAWRAQLPAGDAITLSVLGSDLWRRGIPVVPLESLPAPGFQAMACVVLGRPVILLGHKYDAPGRMAYVVAHEAGHIAHGHCDPDSPVIDEEDEIADDSELESAAELYATTAIVGRRSAPILSAETSREPKALAIEAREFERTTGVEASLLIFDWARRTLDYPTAMMAVRALYRARGARRLLADLCRQHVNLEQSSETDRNLLRCVSGLTAADDAAD